MYRMYRPRLGPFTLSIAILSIGLFAGSALSSSSGEAHAGDPEAIIKGEKVDVSPIRKHLVVASDGSGHYIIAAPKANSSELYYGNGKKFYKQPVIGTGSENGPKVDKSSWHFFAPREATNGNLSRDRNNWTLKCGKREGIYKTLSSAEQKKILSKAKFEIFSFRRQAFQLLRDRRGTYYFIDKHRFIGKDYRLFVGRRGNMKKFKLVDIVDDSEGTIFVTPKGDLNIITNKSEKKGGDAVWTKGNKEEPLTAVPVRRNKVLIYTDLGPYENYQFRTPCEEL